MKAYRLLPIAVIALAGLSLGAGCPTVPSLKDRVVELALGASTVQTIQAIGIVNVYDQIGSEDLVADVDIQKVLNEAGIDASKVKSIKLAGISYRVTVPDPHAGRNITGATVSAGRGPGPAAGPTPTPLITNFSQNVDAVTGWTKAPLDPNGVHLIDGILTDIVALARDGTPVPNPVLSYHVQGVSNPTDATTSFTWQLKLDLTIVGTIKVTVLS